MQKDIQPKYEAIEVRCACGNTFKAGSVKDEIKVEICSECHPFYTGKQKNRQVQEEIQNGLVFLKRGVGKPTLLLFNY